MQYLKSLSKICLVIPFNYVYNFTWENKYELGHNTVISYFHCCFNTAANNMTQAHM